MMSAVTSRQVPYLISRVADPVFAVFIGFTGAFLRIRREESEKGIGTSELWPTLQRRMDLLLASKKPSDAP